MSKNEETRIKLLESLRAFLEDNCHYTHDEIAVATEALKIIKHPIEANENYNARHPRHGMEMHYYRIEHY